MRMLVRAIPYLLGVLFLYAGTYKGVNTGRTTESLMAINVPLGVAFALTLAVASVELYVACILLLSKHKLYPLCSAAGCLVIFTLYLVYIRTLANPPDCACGPLLEVFNTMYGSATFGILRNALLLLLVALYLVHAHSLSRLGGYWRSSA
jgi:hypothetical protein